ncbi:antiviral reverse transcriptase Drt3a [Pseudophaeobacter profundi]|uniref:antiviral reverse transcriptase Drt3a n=1 Tax=Pseudophaeobacter profundi TaxID=3034152 RepID=UPI00242B6315|nr:antiviral reverse transcriptase Drt3a [Pseudophaeobacter profundi]
MLDQTFSGSNLRRVSEAEKRRGRVRDLHFFESVNEKTEELKQAIQQTKEFRRLHPGKYSDEEQAEFNVLKEFREEKRRERDDTLLLELDMVSKKINRKDFEVSFTQEDGPRGTKVYVIDQELPDQFYAIKKLETNLASLYRLKPANRDEVMKQLIGMISDGFDYHVLRTDISSFFESIPHDRLLRKLKNDQLLSQKSLRLISGILFRYGRLAGTPGVGLPRGLGISSYLSELYMREFDQHVKRLGDVVFYARYVDDIVVLFAPLPGADVREKRSKIRGFLSDISLSMNEAAEKTKESPYDAQGFPAAKGTWDFEYLGYCIDFRSGVSVSMSRKRLARYKNRIFGCFQRYESQKSKNYKKAYRLLIKRIRFLTSNTQLTHNKSNAYVGIYFNNMHLTHDRNLRALDAILAAKVGSLSSPSLRPKLSTYSFVKGYGERTFRRFHRKGEFKEIVEAWKYEE